MFTSSNRKSALLVTKNPAERDLLKLALHRIGYHVQTADHAYQVMEKVEHSKPDLLVLDLFLSQTNGLEMLKQIEDSVSLKSMYVIAMTAMAFPEVVEQAKVAGANDILLKPFSTDLLVQKARRLQTVV
ncbi:MAG: response regulator [Chloroflexi bacterium]|nr:MAG: response regulator [Chloroflexota bacterium]MBL1194816.1 response regulator [Chloroflexota bacterium]NOH12107.1 response regulator [Chloroflexota bacterium]